MSDWSLMLEHLTLVGCYLLARYRPRRAAAPAMPQLVDAARVLAALPAGSRVECAAADGSRWVLCTPAHGPELGR